MFRIGLTVAALGLSACAATTPSPYGGMSAQNVNCGAGVLGAAVLGGLAGNQIGKGQGQDLATAAAKKGPVIWYESSPPEAVLKIAATFNKTYPDIKIQFVRNTGGGGIAARIIQESEAGAATASGCDGPSLPSLRGAAPPGRPSSRTCWWSRRTSTRGSSSASTVGSALERPRRR